MVRTDHYHCDACGDLELGEAMDGPEGPQCPYCGQTLEPMAADEPAVETFEAVRYAADGHAQELDPAIPALSDGAILATGSLEECRQAIAEMVGARDERRAVLSGRSYAQDPAGARTAILDHYRWSGTDDDIEAYHESDDEGCGGWAIRRV